ncbi:MAG: SAM-dependent methyltransferase [bacterium]|nr:SAM-dependent methyltransferase [bacterium]
MVQDSMPADERDKIEFGDFQTPQELAFLICRFLKSVGVAPSSIVEPTCGQGSFLLAALETFPSANRLLGIDINSSYLDEAAYKLSHNHLSDKHLSDKLNKVELKQGNFFTMNWENLIDPLPEPLLIIGNPPWVTNSELGSIGGQNLPQKSNFQNYGGFEAISGKSNFDISEWMLIHLIRCLERKRATVAMLCKFTVARKVIKSTWQMSLHQSIEAAIYFIDARRYFNISAKACLLVCSIRGSQRQEADQAYIYVYPDLSQGAPISAISLARTCNLGRGQLVADIEKYRTWGQLELVKGERHYQWRSGIKHDCQKIMELHRVENFYQNGLGERCDLEDECLYPLLKSSDLGRLKEGEPNSKGDSFLIPHRWVIVTQEFIGQDTSIIRHKAPKTWRYLQEHLGFFARRKSSIYKNRPPFAIFAVGDYAFSPWKVAISGLYKKLHFVVVGPYAGKPVMLDDTCYFIACQSEGEAKLIVSLLNSPPAQEFFSSIIFWDAKRPITIEILKQLDLIKVADLMGKREEIKFYLGKKNQYAYNRKNI